MKAAGGRKNARKHSYLRVEEEVTGNRQECKERVIGKRVRN